MQEVNGRDVPQICTDDADLARVRRMLSVDPIWAAYALADLQPGYAAYCRWMTAATTGGEAVALVYRGLEPPVLFTMGQSQALAAVLAQADLPEAIYISIGENHLPVVSRHYAIKEVRPMRRMVLADAHAAVRDGVQGPDAQPFAVTRLTGAHASDVLQLLAHSGPFTPDAFSPAQMDSGVFFGLYAGEELLAVGGTHIVDYTGGGAAIGNMYTHPAYRRRGFSAAILRAIVRELLERGVTTIVLNVDQRNPGAQALYLAHGFVVHVPFFEGEGNRNVDRVQ
jgi:ribosomal protein S18 acetylase RimI-like enzyme